MGYTLDDKPLGIGIYRKRIDLYLRFEDKGFQWAVAEFESLAISKLTSVPFKVPKFSENTKACYVLYHILYKRWYEQIMNCL